MTRFAFVSSVATVSLLLWACAPSSGEQEEAEQDPDSWEAAMELAGQLTPVLKELVETEPLDPTPQGDSPTFDEEAQLFTTPDGDHMFEVGLKTWGDPGLGGWIVAFVEPVDSLFFSVFLIDGGIPEFSGPAPLPDHLTFPTRSYSVEELYLLMEEANRRREWDVEP